MKEIKLSNSDMVALVDDEDYEFLNKWKWHLKRGKATFYSATPKKNGGPTKYTYMHRMILDVPCGMQIDHIDRNGLNNQKINLRLCTHAQNQHNAIGWRNSISKYKGVSVKGKNRKWFAQIEKDGWNRHLGVFEKEEDAARAYDIEAKKLFGEFAKTNFI